MDQSENLDRRTREQPAKLSLLLRHSCACLRPVQPSCLSNISPKQVVLGVQAGQAGKECNSRQAIVPGRPYLKVAAERRKKLVPVLIGVDERLRRTSGENKSVSEATTDAAEKPAKNSSMSEQRGRRRTLMASRRPSGSGGSPPPEAPSSSFKLGLGRAI